MMKRILGAICFLLILSEGWAQHFQFSQYDFTDQRVNPALVAASDFSQVNFDFRNQTTGGDFNLSSTYLSGSYPFLTRKGLRWSGIGVSVMDDRSGVGGIFNTQEVSLAYAVNIYLSRYQTITLGARGLYLQQKVNVDGLFTGSQYIPDRGFDGNISIGENLQDYQVNYFTASFGLYWQQVDRWQNKIAYWGISFYDFNKPKSSFTGGLSELNSTIVAMGGVQIYRQKNFTILPELLYTRNSTNNVFNVGVRWGYEIRPLPNQVSAKIDVLTKYIPGRSVILGMQLHRDKFSVGVSYDIPAAKKNVGNLGAIEVGLRIKKLVSASERNKKKIEQARAKREERSKETRQDSEEKPVIAQDTVRTEKESESVDSEPKDNTNISIQEELKMKQDSVLAIAQAGDIKHEPLVLKKVNLHINFDFNSASLDADSKQYLDNLAVALSENPYLKVQLIGHTDNIGSDRYNKILSQARAEELRNYLLDQGVHPDRITAKGMGESQPLDTNDTEEGRSKNRRVELTILYDF